MIQRPEICDAAAVTMAVCHSQQLIPISYSAVSQTSRKSVRRAYDFVPSSRKFATLNAFSHSVVRLHCGISVSLLCQY